MTGQKEAIVRLLRDNDPDTVRLVREQLLQSGDEAVGDLKQLLDVDDKRISGLAKEVLALIADREAEEDFGMLCYFFGANSDVERASWMLAHALAPGIDLSPYEHKVNSWGRQFLVRSAQAISSRERIVLLANFMSGDLGFRGNSDDYYNERNCLLPSVIESRMGIPITLTLLYMMVGARAGMHVAGVNLPGHFIARHGDMYFDPFHRGRILTRSDCATILAKQNLSLHRSHLADASSRQVLIRVLANLLYVYDLRRDSEKHARVNAWIKVLMESEKAA